VLEDKGLSFQFVFGGHGDLSQELLLVVIVELLHDSVSPWLVHRNEPGLGFVVKTQSDKGSHSPRITPAAKERHLVINLEVLGDSQSLPDVPEAVDHTLGTLGKNRFDSTAASAHIDYVQAVESDWAL
jgi:hypothetical protein